jgi:hypothetical protein
VILVTGGGGLIGGALVARLKSEGFEVWAPDRGSGNSGGLDLEDVSSAVFPRRLQTAFLCAWSGGVSEAALDPESMRRVNVEGNRELIERLKQRGTKVVFLSTSLVFSGAETSSSAPLSPCCVYGAQKAAVEAGLDSRHDVIVRITKVGETLLPRLAGWAKMLRSGGRVAAASHLRVAPVMLEETVEGLVGLVVGSGIALEPEAVEDGNPPLSKKVLDDIARLWKNWCASASVDGTDIYAMQSLAIREQTEIGIGPRQRFKAIVAKSGRCLANPHHLVARHR